MSPASVWWDDAPPDLLDPLPPIDSSRKVDTLVVGAGIAGASIARALAVRGAEVLVVDSEHPGAGATGRNAGFLLAESECFGLTAERHGDGVAHVLRSAGLATRRVVREVAQGRERALRLSFPGSVRLASDPHEAAAFRRSAEMSSELRVVNAARVAERGGASYTCALVDTGDGMVHPLRLLAAVIADARSRGVEFGTSRARSVRRVRGGAVVDVGSGHIRADRVVVAANAATRLLLGLRGIRPVRAQALAAELDPCPKWRRPVYATRGGDYWRRIGRGRVVLGGLRRLRKRQENTRATAPSPELQRALAAHLAELAGPTTEVRVTHRWAGTMAFTSDGLPWVGPLSPRSAISVFAGWNGHGLGWAPGLAETLADHMLSGAPLPASLGLGRAR